MADATTVVEGNIKFREGKKWKPRWCVLKKPSPVADQLQVILYKNVSEVVKNEGKPKSSFALDGFFGLDAGFAYDREQNVLAIICQKNVSLMAFEHRENMIKFEIGIRQGLGEEHQFKVRVAKAPSNSRLPKEQICLMIHDTRFCVVAQSPPKVLLSWNVEDLRRFGARDGKFCFEGGSRCGKGSGVFALQSDQAEDIADIVKLASTGKMSNCHRKFKNRRRASLSSNGENVSEMNYTLLTIPVDITVEEEIDIECRDVLSAPFSFCQSTIDISENGECTSPAKSVLRPRSGQEYVVIQRSSIPVISDSAILSSLSPYLKKEFDFDPHHPKETVCHHQHRHHHHHLHHHHHHAVPSGRLHSPSPCSPPITPQPSPSLASTADTSKSFISLHCEPWERSTHRSSRHGHDGKLNLKSVTATSSPASSPRSAVSHRPLTSVSLSRENGHKSAQLNRTDDTIFFPKHMLFNGSTPLSPVSLNAQPLPSPSPHIHYPIYVNQEFVDKYHNELSSSQTVNSSGNLSSASPRRVGACTPLMSVLLKESPGRHSSNSESHISIATPGKSRTRNRHSESDAHKVDKHLLSLPTAVSSQSMCMPINVHRSHSDPKRDSRGASPQLSMAQEDLPQKAHSKIHGKEYDKFAKSAIISRRRLQCEKQADCSEDKTDSGTSIYSATDTTVEESGMYLQIPGLKSSGYRNIDSINAAAVAAAAATPSPKGVSSGPDASHFGQMSQLENISESQYSPPLSRRSNSPAVQIAVPRPTSHVLTGHKINDNVLSLPHSSSPPPPLPIRKRHSSSPPSTPSVNSSVLTPSDISDSPPPYFAPSPPSSPPPPAVPPRKPLLPPSPSPVPPSTPSEPDLTSELSDEEQELNYIEIDMTKSSSEAPRPPPVTYSRRSKRIRQQKDKDYAKLRYAEIDLTATKALQQTRQERVQGRSDSMRLSKLKDGARRPGSNLSRINSAPPSSKRKQLSFVPRERKLSSGSVESC